MRQDLVHDAVEQFGTRVQQRHGTQLVEHDAERERFRLALPTRGEVRLEARSLGGGEFAVQPILDLDRLGAAVHDGPWMRSLSSARAR